jgi:hypothetical protein
MCTLQPKGNSFLLGNKLTTGWVFYEFGDSITVFIGALLHLITTLHPPTKVPAAAPLTGQPHTPENVLRACRLNTAGADHPYDLTDDSVIITP